MAEKEDLDLDVKPTGSNKKLIIIIVIVALLAVGASVGVTLFLMGGEKTEDSSAPAVVAVPKAHYMPLENMVVNFAQRGPARFLQVEMQLMAHDPQVLKAVEQHMPVIRNDLLVLLAGVSYEQASSREGKEALNQAILNAVNQILTQHGASGEIKAVYFTNFVMQ